MNELLRVYLDPDDIGLDGYPYAWHGKRGFQGWSWESEEPPIKDLIREQNDYRCERCGHPYPTGITYTCPRGEWTPCDGHCTHGQPLRMLSRDDLTGEDVWVKPLVTPEEASFRSIHGRKIQAQWRILTVHHLNGVKHDCRWWNLAALCQRCHLAIQGKVVMNRVWPWEHSEWFKPHAAGWYAFAYLNEELTRQQTMERIDELLNLELQLKADLFSEWHIGTPKEG